jgi:ABC-type glycerol-3-phosphate transport system substrate-binding protein
MPAMTRSPLILAAVAAALALGACGGSSDDDGAGGGASRQDTAFEGALKFSKCMRDHGVDFPDPQRVGSGGIKLTGRNINPNDPNTKAAQRACQKYMQVGGGETLDPAKRAKLQETALRYARCMREHGVDMPDPRLSGKGGLTFQAGPGSGGGPTSKGSAGKGLGVNPDSPKFKEADKACNHILGDAGERPGTQEESK